mmetsp:Transcript_10549/g.13713  ORF Transcript_10549/g.13713 Transcript_10549/m.13713 type:complete len:850 (-) Transcript_10549:53-2602(-)|eukprot:CAMPEP_0116062706 /NCGR_PEP_ID=MMETSP0322-20121206/7943_1 /TAXON_ID=163516 /ORGANISM="Leptocylindrus danicus var. apora, Strain B651" /LENGTH=849 /DNA_ID=CAMNT_0003548113 /DNA_START=450 /DNA_END=2999 /DNA_ORIENTATION=+
MSDDANVSKAAASPLVPSQALIHHNAEDRKEGDKVKPGRRRRPKPRRSAKKKKGETASVTENISEVRTDEKMKGTDSTHNNNPVDTSGSNMGRSENSRNRKRRPKKKWTWRRLLRKNKEQVGNSSKSLANDDAKCGKIKKSKSGENDLDFDDESVIVDPISLDPLDKLQYPPFVLVVNAPSEGEPDLIRFPKTKEEAKDFDINQYHLFDGRVLAYYLVSQMQFIDPLNRRDLSTAELSHLDCYLKEHMLIPKTSKGNRRKNKNKVGVVMEAYKTKEQAGAVNEAGQAAQSEHARADSIQREATEILHALFSGNNGSHSRNQPRNSTSHSSQSGPNSSFITQFEREHREEERSFRTRLAATQHTRNGGYEPQGLRIIDEDSHPELVGDVVQSVNTNHANMPMVNHHHDNYYGESRQGQDAITNSAHSSTGIVVIDEDRFPALHGQSSNSIMGVSHTLNGQFHERRIGQVSPLSSSQPSLNAFPSLDTATTIDSFSNINRKPTSCKNEKSSNNISSSLKRISKLVKPTDRKEVAKQRRARDNARRMLEVSQMTYEEAILHDQGHSSEVVESMDDKSEQINSSQPPVAVNEAKIERNRNLADALGVKSAANRQNDCMRGWSRLSATGNHPLFDEFQSELTMADYPDSLKREAKENIGLILKIERRWKLFLKDDKLMSFQCNPMSKPLRRLIHEYSDFWFLQTQSFDPQPKRYVNCVKTVETKVPHPLLSDSVRSWRGNSETTTALVEQKFISEDVKLDGKVRECGDDMKLRSKLVLAPRTLPLDMPPLKLERQVVDDKKRLKRNERAVKETEGDEIRSKTIFDAFASDSDSDENGSIWTQETPPSFSDEENI